MFMALTATPDTQQLTFVYSWWVFDIHLLPFSRLDDIWRSFHVPCFSYEVYWYLPSGTMNFPEFLYVSICLCCMPQFSFSLLPPSTSRGIPDLSPTSPLSVVTNISPASIIYCRTPPAGTASSVPQTNIYTVQTVLPKHTSPWKSGTNLDHFARRQRSITVLGYNGGSYTNSKTTRGCHQTIETNMTQF